jgi:hypothetical protein
MLRCAAMTERIAAALAETRATQRIMASRFGRAEPRA